MGEDDHLQIGVPKVREVDASPGFTSNHVTIVKGHFCKYTCKQTKNIFYSEDVLLNEEFRKEAPGVFNKESEEEFHKASYDQQAEYNQLAEYVLKELISEGLIIEEKKEWCSAYIPTEKVGNLCRRIESIILPSINKLVEEYDEQERQLLGN
jgi:hypothetical protein